MIGHIDGATNTLGSANGPVLVKRGCADNRRLVDSSGLENVVCAAVSGDGADLGGGRGRVVRAVRLDHVILNERACGPAIDSEVTVAARVEVTGVVDSSGSARVPSLSSDKVAAVHPRNAVRTSSAICVGDSAAAVGPERVVVAIAVPRAAWSASTREELVKVGHLGVVEREGENCGDSREAKDKLREREHGEGNGGYSEEYFECFDMERGDP